ncbi:hypothetical protein BC830DRAFT_1143636 [Chytriomyces sp. MP71]|nr:hypothetical protein BC830DRAFT_1143636 [Chytriomyces sp. MP71]
MTSNTPLLQTAPSSQQISGDTSACDDHSTSLGFLLDRRFSLPSHYYFTSPFSHPNTTNMADTTDNHPQLPLSVIDANAAQISELSRRMSLAAGFAFPATPAFHHNQTEGEVSMTDLLNGTAASAAAAVDHSETIADFARRMSMPFAFSAPSVSPMGSLLTDSLTPRASPPSDMGYGIDNTSSMVNQQFSQFAFPALPDSFDMSMFQQQQQQQLQSSPAFTFQQGSMSVPASPYINPLSLNPSRAQSPITTNLTPNPSPPPIQKTPLTSTLKRASSKGSSSRDPLKLATEAGFDVVFSTPPTSPEHILSRRNSMESGSGKPARFKPSETELAMLTAIFQKNPFPSAALRKKLAEKMGLDMKQVQFWFQNRRQTMVKSGIHVLKPKKGNSGVPSAAVLSKKRMSLTPLSADNAYFYVESGLSIEQISADAGDVKDEGIDEETLTEVDV